VPGRFPGIGDPADPHHHQKGNHRMITTLLTALPESTTTIVAATDLVSGSRALYSIGVGVIVLLILVASGARAMAAFFGGRIGETVSWAVVGVVVSVIVGSSYAIYTSAKTTADQTGLTTGQFGQ
jgi:hypothetical protein